MDIHFVKTVFTAPSDHPRWEIDLLAKLTGVPSQKAAAARTTPAPGPDRNPLFVTPRPGRE